MEEIILAAPGDAEQVSCLYDRVLDHFEKHINYCYPNWQKGKYPTLEDAQKAIEEGTLYVLKQGEAVAASLVIDHSQHPEYKKIPWTLEVPEEQVMVLHMVVVDPAFRGQGLGEKLIRFGIDLCKRAGAKAIRLDTHWGNLPARRLYEKCGFQSICRYRALVDGMIQEFDVFQYIIHDA